MLYSLISISYWHWDDQRGRKLVFHCKSYYQVGYLCCSLYTCHGSQSYLVAQLRYRIYESHDITIDICHVLEEAFAICSEFNMHILLRHNAAEEPILRDDASLREKALVPLVWRPYSFKFA